MTTCWTECFTNDAEWKWDTAADTPRCCGTELATWHVIVTIGRLPCQSAQRQLTCDSPCSVENGWMDRAIDSWVSMSDSASAAWDSSVTDSFNSIYGHSLIAPPFNWSWLDFYAIRHCLAVTRHRTFVVHPALLGTLLRNHSLYFRLGMFATKFFPDLHQYK